MFNKIRDIFKQVQLAITTQGVTRKEKREKQRQEKKRKTKKSKKSEAPKDEPLPEQKSEPVKKSKLSKAVEKQLDKFRKVEITKQEAYRRMGIKDDTVYTVGDKEISAYDIDVYLKKHGIDMIDYFLGSTKDYKYRKKTYKKQQSKFADKIADLAKDTSLDQDYVDALTVMMLGSDIAFDYMTVYK